MEDVKPPPRCLNLQLNPKRKHTMILSSKFAIIVLLVVGKLTERDGHKLGQWMLSSCRANWCYVFLTCVLIRRIVKLKAADGVHFKINFTLNSR